MLENEKKVTIVGLYAGVVTNPEEVVNPETLEMVDYQELINTFVIGEYNNFLLRIDGEFEGEWTDSEREEYFSSLQLKLEPFFVDNASLYDFLYSIIKADDKGITDSVGYYVGAGEIANGKSNSELWGVMNGLHLYTQPYETWRKELKKARGGFFSRIMNKLCL